MDIFFTCDKSNNIAVTFIMNGDLIKHYVNPKFVASTGRITAMCVFSTRLYISDSTGCITTVNLSPILNEGFIEYAGMLKRYVLRTERIFFPLLEGECDEDGDLLDGGESSCSVVSMAVFSGVLQSVRFMSRHLLFFLLSGNGFLGLHDEDTLREQEAIRAARHLSTFVDPVRYDVLEGHVLVVGESGW
jgi:hypothetical protein